jgi:EAL domain-containing protein (putative c-di-GMP-specific phosphodiesterase class I)/CHASE2 domain-containing sensor protein
MGGKRIRSEWLGRVWRDGPARVLFWTGLVALLFGVLDVGRPIENLLYVARTEANEHKASGKIVIVAMDERSVDRIPLIPWPRSIHAKIADRLNSLGVDRVFYDLDFSLASRANEDQAFADALSRLNGRATLALRFVVDPLTGKRVDSFPLEKLRRQVHLANINAQYMAHGAIWQIPYALTYGGRDYPSFAASLARTSGPTGEMFPIDYSIDPASVPVVSAIDILEGRVRPEAVRGKTAVIAPATLRLGDEFIMPRRGPSPGVYAQILGAETLLAGTPLVLGWFLPLLFAAACAVVCVFARRVDHAVASVVVALSTLILLPLLLDAHSVRVEIVPALVMLLGVSGVQTWLSFRRTLGERGTTNLVSGLPNLNALRKVDAKRDTPLVAARVQNYAQICAALETDDERTLAQQIAARLTIGADGAAVYQGDEGIFIWFAAADGELDEHLGALHALFRSPIVVGDNRFDLSITFGVDTSADRSIASRLGGALSAADEAAAESRKWKQYDPGRGGDAAWRLSILSQLDAAIGAGDLWVAYQPKIDVKTRQAIGAEALVRWTHPDKGEISPMEFIPAAEQSGRIEKLTEFVLDRAIRAGSLAVQRCPYFNMSVNLSPKLLGAFALEAKVTELLKKFGLPPECLTLEVTETATLARAEADLAPLHRLRARGIQISIDDYGTGLSTLDYIKRLPASEIKIDKSFVQAVCKSQSDRLMVHSTIQLAHSLGHKVVAEGVEDMATFETLAAMGCDIVQGFYFAKPMTFNHLTPFIPGWRNVAVA